MLLETTADHRNNPHGHLREVAVSMLQIKSTKYVVIYDKCTAFLAITPIVKEGTNVKEFKIVIQILSKFILQYDVKFEAISSSIKQRQIVKCLATFCRQNNILHRSHTADEVILETLTLRAITHLFNECEDEPFEVQIALSAFRKYGSITSNENDTESDHRSETTSLTNTKSHNFANVSNRTRLKTKIVVNSNEHKWRSRSEIELEQETLRPINITTIFSTRKNAAPRSQLEPVKVESVFKQGRDKYMIPNQKMPQVYEKDEKNVQMRPDAKGHTITSNICCCCCGQASCKPPKTCPAVAGHFSRICTNSNRLRQLVGTQTKKTHY